MRKLCKLKGCIWKIAPATEGSVLNIVSQQIQGENDEKGRPIADISKLEIKKIISQDLSISHIENYAMASFTLILDN